MPVSQRTAFLCQSLNSASVCTRWIYLWSLWTKFKSGTTRPLDRSPFIKLGYEKSISWSSTIIFLSHTDYNQNRKYELWSLSKPLLKRGQGQIPKTNPAKAQYRNEFSQAHLLRLILVFFSETLWAEKWVDVFKFVCIKWYLVSGEKDDRFRRKLSIPLICLV